jgi:hypothetical protein
VDLDLRDQTEVSGGAVPGADVGGDPVVYLMCEPSTRYYQIMTRSEWMPVLIGEVI